jgi:hypothetical protein
MYVDCILASPRIAQVNPGNEPLPEVVLSHPAQDIVNHVVCLNNIPCSGVDSHELVCDACLCGKAHQLHIPRPAVIHLFL